MLALNILDVKDFMNQLLIRDTFDPFSLIEASIVTFSTFTIDGKLQQEFFDTDTLATLKETSQSYAAWRDLKSYCFSIIRGKRTPVSFKIVFRLPSAQMQKLFEASPSGIFPEQIGGLYLNLQYKNKALLCTTGVSFHSFVLNKYPEQLWDSMVTDFLQKHGIAFEQM